LSFMPVLVLVLTREREQERVREKKGMSVESDEEEGSWLRKLFRPTDPPSLTSIAPTIRCDRFNTTAQSAAAVTDATLCSLILIASFSLRSVDPSRKDDAPSAALGPKIPTVSFAYCSVLLIRDHG